jgi:hypothetical protein
LIDTGSGRVSSRQARVSKSVQGNPSQAPAAVPMSSVPTALFGEHGIDRAVHFFLAAGAEQDDQGGGQQKEASRDAHGRWVLVIPMSVAFRSMLARVIPAYEQRMIDGMMG